VKSHHEAEYTALIRGLELARGHGVDRLRVFLDSALVVNTVNGDWKTKFDHLQNLLDASSGLARALEIGVAVLGSIAIAEATPRPHPPARRRRLTRWS
jgi:ribonuclease HI